MVGCCQTCAQGHVQSENGGHRFSTVSMLKDMLPRNGVKRALSYVFCRFVGVSEVLPKP